MKRYFAETEDYNVVLFVDQSGRAVMIDEAAFNEPLTLAVAKAADYSNFDGCQTAEEAAANYTGEVIEFRPWEFENVVNF